MIENILILLGVILGFMVVVFIIRFFLIMRHEKQVNSFYKKMGYDSPFPRWEKGND